VRTFHAWCADQLRLYHVAAPADGAYEDMVRTVIRAVERGQIPRAQYGALMIDEGHDFAPEWLQLAVQMLDPVSNSLLLLYDDAQSIYGANRHKSFSFRSVGISAAGRTKRVRVDSQKRSSRRARRMMMPCLSSLRSLVAGRACPLASHSSPR
jgi:hypothetical protein